MQIHPLQESQETTQITLAVEKYWHGEMAEKSEKALVSFSMPAKELTVRIDAPFHNDPAPTVASGELEGLWNYEVVELFLLGTAGHYLEIELGPHGHYLIYHLSGIRKVISSLSPIHCKTSISGSRWQGTLLLDLEQSLLPFSHVNAYAIHGQGEKRQYLSAFPVHGETPDFHQPDYFRSIDKL